MFNILLSLKKAAIYLVVLLLAFFPVMLAQGPTRTYAAAATGEEVVATEPENEIAAAETEAPIRIAAKVSESPVTDFPEIDQLEIPEIANAKIDAREHMIAKRNDLDQEWLKLKMEEKAAAQAAAAKKAEEGRSSSSSSSSSSSGRSWSAGTDLGRFKLTAYCPCYECSEGWGRMTSSGRTAQAHHTIATDPRVIPEGTRVIINGEVYVAEDEGGGVKGNHIDIFYESHEATENFGVQYAEVYIAD